MSLSDIGSYCSVLGLGVSLITLVYAFFIDQKIVRLRRQFLFNTRASSILKDLKEANTSLLDLLGRDYVSKEDDIKRVLISCRALLNSLASKAPTENKVALNRLAKRIELITNAKFGDASGRLKVLRRIFGKDKWNKSDLWKMYYDITYQIKVIENLVKDKKIIQNE